MHRPTLLALVALSTAGCYTVKPIATATPAAGTHVSIDINDAGRVALGGSMGPEIKQVEGSLLSKQDSAYVVSVSGVNYISGGFQAWKGETVRIRPDMVSGFNEKKFSKGRTIAFIAASVVVGVALAPGVIKSAVRDDPPGGEGSELSRHRLKLVVRTP